MDIDWLRLQAIARDELGSRIAEINDWHAPTPDTEWDVTDLVRHVVSEQQWVPVLLAGTANEDDDNALEPLGDDLVAEWQKHSAAAAAAWLQAPLDAPVTLSVDTVTALDFLSEHVAHATIHTWDLARAIGANETLNDELVAAAWTIFEPQKDTLEASGLFASIVPLPDDAPLQSRLLALTGRDDRV